MANNITWADRTDASTPTGVTSEADKTIYNTLKAWANSPSGSLGAFSPAMTFDGQGNYNDYTPSASATTTFSATGIVAGNVRKVKYISDGTQTLVAGAGVRLLYGNLGRLVAGTYDILFASYDTNEVLISIPASEVQTNTYSLDLDGVDAYATAATSTDFEFGDGSTTREPFSIAFLMKPTNALISAQERLKNKPS